MRLIVSATFSLVMILLMSSVVVAQFTLDDQDFGTFITIGAAWGDYDEDGDEDLYLANGSLNGDLWVNYLYTNDGNGNFTQVTDAGTIVSDAFTSGGCSWGDYNDDGLLDMLVAHPVTNSASPYESKNSLYLNNGDGTFSELGSDPLTDIVDFSRIDPAGADWDGDGFLDIVCSNATFFGTGSNHSFFTNNGDGTFTSVSNELTTGTSARGTVNWVDIDQDGDMDVLTASGAPGQQTVLWVNNGVDFDQLIIIDSGQGVGQDTKSASFGDFDNDGDFDLYLANSGDNPDTNLVFRNDGLDDNNLPILTKLGAEFGNPATDVDYSLTSGWADVDNDGDLDLFVGNDGGYPDYNSKIYINDNGTFTDGTSGDLLTGADFAHTAAFADIESDGDLDLMVGRDGQNRLFINEVDTSKNWAIFKLNGLDMNKAGIGAVVKAKANINGSDVWQVRQITSHSGAGSQNSLLVHFGLGDAEVIDELIVKEIGAGVENSYFNLSVDKISSPSLAVLTPNDIAFWPVDSIRNISWEPRRTFESFNIQISRDGGLTWTNITEVPGSQTSYEWVVEGPVSEKCRIKVLGYFDSETKVHYDVSDKLFIIDTVSAGRDVYRQPITDYQLMQNYPNPFNPVSTIEFILPKREFVELTIYNTLGSEVSTLVSQNLNAGNHKYLFDGKNLASGVYYFQLSAGEFTEMKKMILIR